MAGERADADRSPLSPVVLLVGADGSQARSASMQIWKLKAAPPPDLGGGKKEVILIFRTILVKNYSVFSHVQ
jgi:hypothetical protein